MPAAVKYKTSRALVKSVIKRLLIVASCTSIKFHTQVQTTVMRKQTTQVQVVTKLLWLLLVAKIKSKLRWTVFKIPPKHKEISSMFLMTLKLRIE